jgi:hypothetical protein
MIESHLSRIESARTHKECKKLQEYLRPGSGKIWLNQLTKPRNPKITGLGCRSKST